MFRKRFLAVLPILGVTASAALGQTSSLLQIVTNNAGQQIEVEIGPVPGEVVVIGVNGGSSVSYTGITAIDLRTGSGQDFVEFRIDTTVIPSVVLNTAGGISDVKFIYELPFESQLVTSDVTVTGGTTHDSVDFLVNTNGNNFDAAWNVSHAAGDNKASAQVNVLQASDSVAIAYNGTSGAGHDSLSLSLLSNAANVDLSVTGTMGGGNDSASIYVTDESGAAAITTAFSLDLGAGLDAANAEVVSLGTLSSSDLSGSILGGTGNDVVTLKLEGNGAVNVTLDGGAGADVLDISGKADISGTPRLLGGTGNDELKIVVDGPVLSTPFLDGGPGIDKATGFGTIINVEQIG